MWPSDLSIVADIVTAAATLFYIWSVSGTKPKLYCDGTVSVLLLLDPVAALVTVTEDCGNGDVDPCLNVQLLSRVLIPSPPGLGTFAKMSDKLDFLDSIIVRL